MRIAFIGYGNVGALLADHLHRLGHTVTLAAKDPSSDSVRKVLALNGDILVASPPEAVASAEVVFLATPFQANQDALSGVAPLLTGKVLIDCTNPVGPSLTHGLDNVQSGSEMIQGLVPEANVVKAFTIYGYENFQDNAYPAYNVKPAMIFCGNNSEAKKIVAMLISQLGWEPLDAGGLDQALHLEHLTLLWVRLVRVNGHSPNLVWAALKR